MEYKLKATVGSSQITQSPMTNKFITITTYPPWAAHSLNCDNLIVKHKTKNFEKLQYIKWKTKSDEGNYSSMKLKLSQYFVFSKFHSSLLRSFQSPDTDWPVVCGPHFISLISRLQMFYKYSTLYSFIQKTLAQFGTLLIGLLYNWTFLN